MRQNRESRFLFLLVVLVLFSHCPVSAQLRFQRFSNREGFNQNTITSIQQDKYGILWFGTPNGLIKYDGYEFFSYTPDSEDENTISHSTVECMLASEKGNLWIGDWNGVDVYLPTTEKFISVPFGRELHVVNMIADSDGNFWIAGLDGFYHCSPDYSGDEVSFEVSDNLMKLEPALTQLDEMCMIDENRLLFSKGNALFSLRFETTDSTRNPIINSVHNYVFQSERPINVIKKINDIFWIGTGSGLYKAIIDGEQLRILEKVELPEGDDQLVSDLVILSVFEDKSGSIWIGTGSEGIFRYHPDQNRFENFGFDPKNKNGISSARINCFYQDNYNVLWIGTAQGGINKLDMNQKQFINYSYDPYDKQSIAGDLVTNILEDRQGRLWLTSYGTGVCRSIKPVNDQNIGNLQFENLREKIALPQEEFVVPLFEDTKGYIWLGTERSLLIYDPGSEEYKKIELVSHGELQSELDCRIIVQLDSNTILLGGRKVFLLHNPWTHIQNESKPQLNVHPVLEGVKLLRACIRDRNNDYWLGTQDGVHKCEYINNELNIVENYSTYSNGLRLSYNNVFSLHEDTKGNIWVGTFGGGLNKLVLNQSGQVQDVEYFKHSGLLPDDGVYGVLEEDDEHLWISTDKGLCRLNTLKYEVELYDMRDGLPHNNFRLYAYHKGVSGYFYFGGLNGLTVFKPENIILNDIAPKALITGISINNKRVPISEKNSRNVIHDYSMIETDKITLPYEAKTVAFHLAIQHYATPSKNRMSYMLEGFNEQWIETESGKSTATFTSLPQGNYVLRVKGANGDAIWNKETTNLSVTVLPPWYRTWWSYTLFVLIVVAVVIGVMVYILIHERLKHRFSYEQKDKQRIDSINKGRLQFFTNVSHEFRTPLTLITGPLEKVMERNRDDENAKYLSTIQNNAKRLMRLVDQLIMFRKAEQGHLSINVSRDTLGNFIYPSTEAFEDYAIQKNINFFYKINSPNEEVLIDQEKTERIIFNLLSNSFRFTPPDGTISIDADAVTHMDQKMVAIKVSDTGKGIPQDKQDQIFERFFQLEGRKEILGGTGIGLAFCKSLVDLMGGTISVESEPNHKTCFTVLIPSKSINEDDQAIMGVQHSLIKDWMPVQNTQDEAASGTPENTTEKQTVLVVEDEVEVRDFLMNELGHKYSIVLAENGVDGWKKISQHKPDLIVSDVMMPEMDGFKLCEKIKSNPETWHIPVILLTALGDHENVIKGLEFRADGYISKPFSPRHLEIRVESLIENRQRLKDYFSKHSVIPDKTIEISTRDKDFLNQVIDAIEKNLSDSDFGVIELAQEVRLSPSQFYRRLKQLTGVLPNVYLRNYRLQRAARLLSSNEGLNVTEVMYQIGIESISYFSTSFKKLHGVSPSEFVKSQDA
ncbi:MAG: response regulator [Bacteroidetes bacterium]|nr:response regulator [Bacteroidota bacterium]